MAEIHSLLLALLFLAILVIGIIALMGIGIILYVLFVRIARKLTGERREGE